MSSFALRQLNALAVLGIVAILGYAFLDQFVSGDLPCPLCLLQRLGFVLAGFGFAMNVVFGCRPSHYTLAILSALGGAAVAARQVMLHIAPGSGSYGEALMGLHFYTWAFIAFALIVAGAAFLMLFESQFVRGGNRDTPPRWWDVPLLGRLAVILLLVVTLANGLSTVAECGHGLCPDDPTGYLLLGG